MAATPASEYEDWLKQMPFRELTSLLQRQGCSEVLVKRMADRQDNDKNQIYIGKDLIQLGRIPMADAKASQTDSDKPGAKGKTKFTAALDFKWLSPTGPSPAPDAKLIFYPQYPETRLSGLLKGSPNPPTSLYARAQRGSEIGRYLLLGLSEKDVHGIILPPGSRAIPELEVASSEADRLGAFWTLRLTDPMAPSQRQVLIDRLAAITKLGWVPTQRLSNKGLVAYTALNAGGYTLEALLGVANNGRSEPDFEGWEIKARKVVSAERIITSGAVTLMTPEPTGGLYREDFLRFMKTHGKYNHEEDRLDFTGKFNVGGSGAKTRGVYLTVRGWDGKNLTPDANVALLGPSNETLATWSVESLVNHWIRKHSRCAYISYEHTRIPSSVRFSKNALFCEGATLSGLLRSFESGTIYYDPGINVKAASSPKPRPKKRSQFRVKYADIHSLYDRADLLDVQREVEVFHNRTDVRIDFGEQTRT